MIGLSKPEVHRFLSAPAPPRLSFPGWHGATEEWEGKDNGWQPQTARLPQTARSDVSRQCLTARSDVPRSYSSQQLQPRISVLVQPPANEDEQMARAASPGQQRHITMLPQTAKPDGPRTFSPHPPPPRLALPGQGTFSPQSPQPPRLSVPGATSQAAAQLRMPAPRSFSPVARDSWLPASCAPVATAAFVPVGRVETCSSARSRLAPRGSTMHPEARTPLSK